MSFPPPYRNDAVQTIAFSGLSGTYAQFTNPINHNWRFIDFTNTCNADVYISFDGTTNNIFLAAGSFRIYDLATNEMVLSKQTKIYAKTSGSPTSGLVSVTGGYQQGT